MGKRKRLAIILSATLCTVFIAASFGTTYAYLVDSDKKKNSFTVGETVTTIIEEFEPPKKLEPGISFKKAPTVKNIGNLPCYVRMRADFSDSNMKELCEDLDIDENWEYNATDEYYYYKKLLLPGADEESNTTTPLFTTVTIRTNKSDEAATPITEEDMKDFDILIYAESKQHVDHAGDHPANEYLTIWE